MSKTLSIFMAFMLAASVFHISPAMAKNACKWGNGNNDLNCKAAWLSTGCLGLKNVSGRAVMFMIQSYTNDGHREVPPGEVFRPSPLAHLDPKRWKSAKQMALSNEAHRMIKPGATQVADYVEEIKLSDCATWERGKWIGRKCYDVFDRSRDKRSGGGCGCRYFSCLDSPFRKPFQVSGNGTAPSVTGDRKVGALMKHEPRKWKRLKGAAKDIGAGADGSIFVVGNDAQSVYRWDARKKDWVKLPGGLARIDVGPDGNPVGVNKQQGIYRYNGEEWIKMPGAATDVGIGADGTIWVVNAQGKIYRWNEKGNVWKLVPGEAVRIDVDPQGNAWVVNSQGGIYRYDGSRWIHMKGWAWDISIGGEGTVMILSSIAGSSFIDSHNVGQPYVWGGKTWKPVGGYATKTFTRKSGESITVDGKGHPWIVSTSGLIHGYQP